MQEITFKNKTAYQGRNGWGKAIGLDAYVRDTMNYEPGTIPTAVVAITPTNHRGPAPCEIEVPMEQIGEFVEAVGRALKDNVEFDTRKTRFGRWMEDSQSPGSFYKLIFEAMAKADSHNAARLVAAFPEQFCS